MIAGAFKAADKEPIVRRTLPLVCADIDAGTELAREACSTLVIDRK